MKHLLRDKKNRKLLSVFNSPFSRRRSQMVRINGISDYPGFELSRSNFIESKRMEIWSELAGVRVTEVTLYEFSQQMW